MSHWLTDRIDPWRIAEGEERLSGELDVSKMARLAAEILDASGQVRVELRGGGSSGIWPVLNGRAEVDISVVCQRCLEPLSIPLRVEFRLGLVEAEDAAADLPEELDPLIVRRFDTCSSSTLVEDELILGLPIAPRHDGMAECGGEGFKKGGDDDTPRPFSDLGELWARAKDQE